MALTKPPVLPPWAEAGDKVQPTNAEIQTGWPLSNTPPARQRWNWILNFLANGVRYLTRRGLPDYGADETYMIGDRVIGDDGKTYRSIQDNNINHAPSASPLWWEEWAPSLSRLADLLQKQTYTAFTTAGAAPNFTLTPAPAITAYTAGQRFRVKFHAAGAGADVLNVSGLGNKSLKQYDSTGAKVGAVIAANQLADVEYDGVDMVILDALPASFGTTPPQFDNDTSFATTAFVQRALGSMSSAKIVNATGNILAEDAGKFIEILGASGNITLTLPDISTVPAGTTFELYNNAGFGCTIQRSGSATIADGSGVAQTSYTLRIQSTARFISDGFNWFLTSGFGGHLPASNGYQRLPNGIIIQWMQFAKTTTASPISNSWPIAFPNALWNISGTIGGTANPNGGAISASGNTTQVTIYTTSGQPGGTIMVIGIGN